MSDEYIPYFFRVFLYVLPFSWFGIIRFLMEKAKMSKELDVKKFVIIKTSNWGTGIVNGVSFKNCLRVIDTKKGYIFETKKPFDGRKLWLLKEGLDIRPLAWRLAYFFDRAF